MKRLPAPGARVLVSVGYQRPNWVRAGTEASDGEPTAVIAGCEKFVEGCGVA